MASRKRKYKRFKFNRQRFSKKMQEKLVLIFVITLLAFVVLIGRVTHINATRGSDYTRVVLRGQTQISRNIPFERGSIVDRNGVVLATNERVFNVILDVFVMTSREASIEPSIGVLSYVFDIDEDVVRELIQERPHSSYEILMRGVGFDRVREFNYYIQNREHGRLIQGIWFEEDFNRIYPLGSLASPLIGFCGAGNVGVLGIEKHYNEVLNGTDGREYGFFGAETTVERTIQPPRNGYTVVSTIDVEIQSIVERHIREFNEEHAGQVRLWQPGSRNTAVLVMNPNNGEVLAMASYPNFDLNNPSELSHIYTPEQLQEMTSEDKTHARNEMWRNFVIADPFEPGSTVKPFTVAAALDAGILSPDCTFYCGGMIHVGDHDIHCMLGVSHGYQNLAEVMALSCNVATMNIAMRMGTSIFSRYQENFGFGQFTGIDLPGEADTSGVIYTYENMMVTDLATNGFGQNFELTMIQMGAAFSSLINGGNLYAPRVVSRIQDEAGRLIQEKSPVLLRRTVSEETVALNLEYMKAVMTIGTGITANVPGYEIGGKTGTAEKLPRGMGNYLISFVGYAPFDNPEVLVFVVIDEPNVEDQTNGELVRELSVRIMADIFPILEIPMIDGFVPETGDEDDENDEYGSYHTLDDYGDGGWWYNPYGTDDWIFIPYEPIPWYEGAGYDY